MALIDVDILSNEETIVSDANADTGDTIDVNLLGSGTLVVDGVDVSVNSLVGVGVYDLTFAAQNGGSLTINQGLLDLDLLSSVTFEIRDNGTITLNASLLDVGLLDTLNTSTTVTTTVTPSMTGMASDGTERPDTENFVSVITAASSCTPSHAGSVRLNLTLSPDKIPMGCATVTSSLPVT